MNEEQLTAWIAREVHSPKATVERVGYGASRATYVVDTGGGDDLVARVDTGDGPMAGTELSLAREAEVYRALAGTTVRIPRLRAMSDDGSALLIARAGGTHEMTDVPDPARLEIYADYLKALAELHRVDAASLDLPSFRRPSDGPSHALGELDLWGKILQDRTTQPWPLAHFGLAVLRRCAPDTVARTVLCHGDVGPGNFMHNSREVTAMLDWEFSHLGDPMDDLAWWVFRGHDMAGGCGDLAAQLAQWSSNTGLSVEVRSIEYYRAVVMLRWLISVASALDHGGGGMDRSVYFGLVPVLAVRLTHSLGSLLAVPLSDPGPVPTGRGTPASVVIKALRDDLDDVVAPAAAHHPEARRRLVASALYLSHLDAVDRIGRQVWDDELADVERVTGRQPLDVAEGHRQVADVVRTTEQGWDEMIRYFWRAGHREVALWPLVAPRALGEPTAIPAVGGPPAL